MRKIITRSEEETRELGAELWRENKKYLGKRAVVFALEGEMGTGKTQLIKGLAKAMGVKNDVFSPTFIIEAEYGGGKLVHVDAWRMEDEKELLEIGFEKRLAEKKVMVIEWADKVRKILKQVQDDAVVIWIRLEHRRREGERVIKIL